MMDIIKMIFFVIVVIVVVVVGLIKGDFFLVD